MNVDKKYDIFISYRHNNTTLINELVQKLGKYYKIFWDQRIGSGYWDAQIEKAIDNSSAIIINFNENSLKKKEDGVDWFYHEIVYSMNCKKQEQIIPVCYDNFRLPDNLELEGLTEEEQNKLALLRDRHQQIIDIKELDKIVEKLIEYLRGIGIEPQLYNKSEIPQNIALKLKGISTTKSFKGRKEEIYNAINLIEENDIVFLSGIGGIGKTELARRITEEMTGEYRCIFCRYENDLKTTLGKIGIIGIEGDSFEEKEDALKKLLTDNVLLVIDNFDFSFDEDIDEYIEEFSRYECKKLITTRNSFSDMEFDFKVQTMAVGNLADSELRELFEEKYGENIADSQLSKILDFTGRLTLAVPILASLCTKSAMTIDELCEKIDAGLKSFEDSEIVHYNKDGNKKGTVPGILRVLFNMNGMSEGKKKTLCNLSLLQFMRVTRSIYKEFAFENSRGNLNDFNELAESGWIKEIPGDTPQKSYFELHPLVDELVREDLKPSYETSPEVFETFSKRMADIIQTPLMPGTLLADFVAQLNLSVRKNYLFTVRLLAKGSLSFAGFKLSENKKRIKRALEEVIYEKDVFSDTDAIVVCKLLRAYNINENLPLMKKMLRRCFDAVSKGNVKKEYADLIIKNLEGKALIYRNSEKRGYYLDFLYFLFENYSELFPENYIENLQKLFDEKEKEKEKRLTKRINLRKIRQAIKAAPDLISACDIALQAGGEGTLLSCCNYIFDRFLKSNPSSDNCIYVYNELISRMTLDETRHRITDNFVYWYFMNDLNCIQIDKCSEIVSVLAHMNDDEKKLLAAMMCNCDDKVTSVIKEILYSSPVNEKNIPELRCERRCMKKIYTWLYLMRNMKDSEFALLFEYVLLLEKQLKKDEWYNDILFSWFNLLADVCVNENDKKLAFEKKEEYENNIRGFSLKKRNE